MATNPGLTYDPRNSESAKFWAAVEKDLAKRFKALEAGGQGATKSGVRPLKDPGRPVTANFPNPRFKMKSGFAVRV